MNEKEIVDSLILGSLLGDGHIEQARKLNKIERLGFTQCSKNGKEVEYINLKHKMISNFYRCNPIINGNNNTIRFSLSTRDPEVVKLTSRMVKILRYPGNKRKIPDISEFNPVVMLFWYLDDGSLSVGKQKRPNGRKPSISRRLKITLTSYRDEDILNFINEFKNKTGIEFRVSRYKGKIESINIKKIEEIIKFLDYLSPFNYLVPEKQKYKLCPCFISKSQKDIYKYNKCEVQNENFCRCREKYFSF